MTKQIQISNFTQVKKIVSAASQCKSSVGVHDRKGSTANAKSILGMMSLDFSRPVSVVCENAGDLQQVLHSAV